MSYRMNVIGDNPLVYYDLEEATGTTAIDSSGRQANGTYSSAPSAFHNSLVSNGLRTQQFVGTREMQATLAADIFGADNPDQSFTLEAWAYAPTLAGDQKLLGRETSGLYLSNTSAYFQLLTTDGVEVIYFPLPYRQVYYVVGVYDGSSIAIYVNGLRSEALTLTGTLAEDTTDLLVGGIAQSTDNVFISNVAIYSRVLSGDEIQDHYIQGVAESYESQLIRSSSLYYDLSDDSASIEFQIVDLDDISFRDASTFDNLTYDEFLQQEDITLQGQRITGYDIGELGVIAGSRIDWDSLSNNILVEVSYDNGDTWEAAENHSTIPGLDDGTDTTDMVLRVRMTFLPATFDDIPRISKFKITIYASKNVVAINNAAVAIVTDPVTLAQYDNNVLEGNDCRVALVGGSITLPADVDGHEVVAFDVLVRTDETGIANVIGAGSAGVFSSGTVNGLTTWVNGEQRNPVAGDFEVGRWVHIYAELTTPEAVDIILNGGYSYALPAIYWQPLAPNVILNHAKAAFGRPTVVIEETTSPTLTETDATAYKFAWTGE